MRRMGGGPARSGSGRAWAAMSGAGPLPAACVLGRMALQRLSCVLWMCACSFCPTSRETPGLMKAHW